VIQGGAPAPSLERVGLRLSMASGLDSVADVVDVTGVADLVVCRRVSRGKLVPLLLSVLGAPGLRSVRAAARGVTAASAPRWGVCVKAVPLTVVVSWDDRESMVQH
jgi:hypothetical protein